MKNQKGVALLMALSIIGLIQYIVMMVTYETQVEYSVNAQAISKLKAYYAAKSGVQINLLRLSIYQKAQAQLGDQLGDKAQMLNLIWSFPFIWPPPTAKIMSGMDKDSFKKISAESFMKSDINATTEDEGSKIDINDLASPSKELATKTKTQIENILKTRIAQDDDWARNNKNLRYDEIVNNIIDWIDNDTVALNGGDERSYYDKVRELDRDAENNAWPPNRWFRSIEEVRMVPGVTDEVYNILSSTLTVFGQKGINPNQATKDVLKSIDPSITDEIANEIMKRRDDKNAGGPFKDKDDFFSFIQNKGARINSDDQSYIPLVFTSPKNFKITSSGLSSKSAVEITAYVYDLGSSSKALGEQIKNDKNNPDGGNVSDTDPSKTGGPGGTGKKTTTAKKSAAGPPPVVYWIEK
jgi:general secretion pathway protein K